MSKGKEEKKVQITLSEKLYDSLLYMRVEEHTTIETIIQKAILEYAENHCPESLE